MFRFILIAAIAAALVQASPHRAAADIIFYESLDLAVMRSDLVVRGKVIEIASNKGDNGVVLHHVTVRVTETIKGEKLKEVLFLVREVPFANQTGAWRNQRDELLLCLNALERQGESGPNFVLCHRNFSWAILLNGSPGVGGPIYSVDFKSLTDPQKILTAARAAVGDKARKPGTTLEWIVQGPLLEGAERPFAVLYPDSERVRSAGKQQRVDLLPFNK